MPERRKKFRRCSLSSFKFILVHLDSGSLLSPVYCLFVFVGFLSFCLFVFPSFLIFNRSSQFLVHIDSLSEACYFNSDLQVGRDWDLMEWTDGYHRSQFFCKLTILKCDRGQLLLFLQCLPYCREVVTGLGPLGNISAAFCFSHTGLHSDYQQTEM